MENKEPYRATKLWNEVILAFQHGIPVKKHRRKMHTHSECFMASDAVTWLHCYLMNNPNFGLDVTRQQTVNLLGKFLKCHVIEPITNKSRKCEFLDGSHLYRFTKISPQQLKACPLRPVQSPSVQERETKFERKDAQKSFRRCHKSAPDLYHKENIPECLLVERKMTLSEIGRVWKDAILERLQEELKGISLNDILDEKSVNGIVVKHNVCRISRTGVVCLIDKTDDIPHWVVSAMKCLANWPKASGSGSCLPNYPGFEKDVFKVVRDFFINPQVPLVPPELSSAMSAIFSYFLHDQLELLQDTRCNRKNAEKSSLMHRSISLAKTEIKTSTPVLNIDGDIYTSKNASSENSHGKLLLDDPEVMFDYPSAIYYETDFANSNPVTKMVSNLSDSRTLIYDPLHGSTESVSTISMCSVMTKTNSFNHHNPSTPLKNWNSDSCLQADKRVESQSLQLQRNISTENIALNRHSMFDYLSIPFADNDSLNESICSSKTITPEDDKESICSFANSKDFSTADNQNNVSANSNESSPSTVHENFYMSRCLKQFEDFTFPDKLKSSIQLLLLFLLPSNRRQLHLLFRVMNKILKNKKFVFDIKIPMRDYLLQTFLPAIIASNDNPVIIYGISSFLLDNCELLFTPPLGLKEQIEEVCSSRNGKIVYSVDDACYLTYCEMVSKQQYEEQKISMSYEALKNLLVNIVQNKNLSEKEKKKRIKQFKENHPDIYYDLFPAKPNFQRSKSSFLNRFANLRM